MAENLSREEVALLLRAVEEDGGSSAPGTTNPDNASVTPYEFDRDASGEARNFRGLLAGLAGELEGVLSPLLRLKTGVSLVSADDLEYTEFVGSIVQPATLAIVRLAPLEGNAVFDLGPGVIFPMIERVLGGAPRRAPAPRALTEIEGRIALRIVGVILDGIRQFLTPRIELHPEIVGLETNPFSLRLAGESDRVILARYEVHIGTVSGTLRFCVPLAVLERIPGSRPEEARAPSAAREALIRRLSKARISVDVLLGRAEVPLHDIAQLEVGKVIPLTSAPGDTVTIEVDGTPRFHAKPATKNGRTVARITGIIRD